MPNVQEGESEQDFVSRCVPLVLEEGTAEDDEQAVAICHSMYDEAHKGRLTLGLVEKVCPPCAEKMKAKGLTELELPTEADGVLAKLLELVPAKKAEEPKQPAHKSHLKAYASKSLSVDLERRTIRHWITTIDVDDDGEVLLPKGADMSRFLKTRTVFDNHDYKTRSILGRNIDYDVTARGILGVTRMTPRPPSHPKEQEWFPDTVLWLHHTGDLSGWSVGFDPVESRVPTVKDRMEFGSSDPEKLRRVHHRWRMLEYSVAPIPVNEDARNLALAKGYISPRLAGWLEEGREPHELKTDRSRTLVVVVPRAKSVQEHVDEAARLAVARKMGALYLDS